MIIFDNKVYNKKNHQLHNNMDTQQIGRLFIRYCSMQCIFYIADALRDCCDHCGKPRVYYGGRQLACYKYDDPKCKGLAVRIADLRTLYDELDKNDRMSFLVAAHASMSKYRQNREVRSCMQLVLTAKHDAIMPNLCSFLDPPIKTANLCISVLERTTKSETFNVDASLLHQGISTNDVDTVAQVAVAQVAQVDMVAHVDAADAADTVDVAVADTFGICCDAAGTEYTCSKLTEGNNNKVLDLMLRVLFYILKNNGGDFDDAVAKMHNMHCIFDDADGSPHAGFNYYDGSW